MTRPRTVLALVGTVFAFALAGAAPAAAGLDDGNGKEWRQLDETKGLGWSQVAAICPRDGATPCSGSIGPRSLTGWTWATDAQVVSLLGAYEPAILTATPPSVSGGESFGSAMGFLAVMPRSAATAGTSPTCRSRSTSRIRTRRSRPTPGATRRRSPRTRRRWR